MNARFGSVVVGVVVVVVVGAWLAIMPGGATDVPWGGGRGRGGAIMVDGSELDTMVATLCTDDSGGALVEGEVPGEDDDEGGDKDDDETATALPVSLDKLVIVVVVVAPAGCVCGDDDEKIFLSGLAERRDKASLRRVGSEYLYGPGVVGKVVVVVG
jgi:hypothetical protein